MSHTVIRARFALPLFALLAGALETARLRVLFPWRPAGALLFAQAALSWLAFGVLVWPLALWIERWIARRLQHRRLAGERERGSRAALVLACTMALPVLAHSRLDRHTRMGGDVSALLALGPWLELALAIGIVLAVAWFLEPLLVHSSARVLGPAMALLACLVGTWPRQSVSHAAGAASSQPNLLLLVLDTCRSDALAPCGGPGAATLQRLGEEALIFDEARSASIFTLTSHLSLLTGVLPSTHGASLSSMVYDPRRAESIAELLRRAGYRTGAFVGADVLSGVSGLTRGFEVYDDGVDPGVCSTALWALVHDVQSVLSALGLRRANGRPHWFQDFQRPASEVLARAEDWIRSGGEQPWFALVNLYDAHWPYLPSRASEEELVAPYDGPLDGFLFRSDSYPQGYAPDAEDRAHVHGLYRAEVLDLDRSVGAFLDCLDLANANTGVLLTSDHGEAFGEGSSWMHEDVLEAQVRVPLFLRPPPSLGSYPPGPIGTGERRGRRADPARARGPRAPGEHDGPEPARRARSRAADPDRGSRSPRSSPDPRRPLPRALEARARGLRPGGALRALRPRQRSAGGARSLRLRGRDPHGHEGRADPLAPRCGRSRGRGRRTPRPRRGRAPGPGHAGN